MRPLLLRSQDEILAEIKAEVGDPATGGLWGDTKIYRAMNRALARWGSKVVYPRFYTVPSGGFSTGTYTYALPRYLRGPIDIEIMTSAFGNLNNQIGDNLFLSVTYAYVPASDAEPTTGDGAQIRFGVPPYTQTGRYRYWVENGRIFYAATPPQTVGVTSNVATSTVIDILAGTFPMIADIGWIKLDNEYIGYTDIVRTSTTQLTLLNLDRGLFGSVAAIHADNTNVFWCVMADDWRLWDQLEIQTIAYMHESLLHRGTMQDRSNHEKLVNHMQQEADQFWTKTGYVTARETTISLDQLGIGRLPLY